MWWTFILGKNTRCGHSAERPPVFSRSCWCRISLFQSPGGYGEISGKKVFIPTCWESLGCASLIFLVLKSEVRFKENIQKMEHFYSNDRRKWVFTKTIRSLTCVCGFFFKSIGVGATAAPFPRLWAFCSSFQLSEFSMCCDLFNCSNVKGSAKNGLSPTVASACPHCGF